jgi:serine/tyrosine/threonine adenylyltransferase
MLDAMFAFMARSGVSWDGFFHDWFGGVASHERALSGPRADVYQGPDFEVWRAAMEGFAPDRLERLSLPYFQRLEPVSLVIEEVEALWEGIALRDDWSVFEAKIAAIEDLKGALA